MGKTFERNAANISESSVNLAIQRMNNKIRYVKQNVFIGTPIRMKIPGGCKTEFRVLKLKKIEGIHYIFESEHGWLESYTMYQLCTEVANGHIKIIREDKTL